MAMDKDKQMEMLFEEGGIADDGMSVDPVSGNRVPAGSMASEVRDDVPAQLSEGEYVVPADVTRYYGVKFFEDLRTQAKMGLGEMEQEGRIGGEPVAVEEGVLTPEEEEVLNMAMGGFVGKQGYNEGGSVASNVAPQFTMANYLFGGAGLGSFGTGTGSAGSEGGSEGGTAEDRAVILYGPNGATVSLVLPAQQAEYEAYLEQGYSETQNVTTQQSRLLAGGDGDNIRDFQEGSTRGGTGSVSSGFSEAPSYGTGLGTLGNTIAGGALGLGIGGVGGMLKGAESFREAAEFNNARNDLVSALQNNDMEAIAEAEADIRSTFEELNRATKAVGVYNEGKTAQEAINNVRNAVSMSRTTTGVDSDDRVPSYEAIPGSTSSAIGGGYQGPNLGTGVAGYNVVDPSGTGGEGDGNVPSYAATPGATSSAIGGGYQGPNLGTSVAGYNVVAPSDTGGGSSTSGGGFGGSTAPDREGNVVTRAIDNVLGTSFADTDKDGESGEAGGNDGKVVCTAMNNSYGFGSYRQAVWLRYSEKNLTAYHEKGYHKIFLPLVHKAYNSGEKNSMTLRKALENIARHRTADLRAEMQGKKRNTLGRIYRAVLEPLCYIVGRFSK